jgi:putative endonuclease
MACGRLSKRSGQHWEKVAESFLHSNGLKLVQRNFSSRFGEIDLIMEDEKIQTKQNI